LRSFVRGTCHSLFKSCWLLVKSQKKCRINSIVLIEHHHTREIAIQALQGLKISQKLIKITGQISPGRALEV